MFGVWRTRDGDRLHGDGAFQFERLYVRVTPWRVILAAGGVAAYALGLVAFLPPEAVLDGDRDSVGTVWDGETSLEPGFAARWTLQPWRSIAALAPSATVSVRGPDTLIAGQTSGFGDGMRVQDVQGAGSVRLLSTLAPALPLACDGEMTVRVPSLAPGGGRPGAGTVRTGPLRCASEGTSLVTPALTGALTSDAEGSGLSVTTPEGTVVATARLARGQASTVAITEAGAAVVPGLRAGTLEFR